jgi:asparaginyl-tRNA synthetase
MFRVTALDLNKLPRTDGRLLTSKKTFFGREANLTVSGQLEDFRRSIHSAQRFIAENSNTTDI